MLVPQIGSFSYMNWLLRPLKSNLISPKTPQTYFGHNSHNILYENELWAGLDIRNFLMAEEISDQKGVIPEVSS